MRIQIDTDECIGCGQCEMMCPEVFEMLESGFAHVIDNEQANDPGLEPEKLEEKIQEKIVETVELCPVSAISI
jgi:ferredoxin